MQKMEQEGKKFNLLWSFLFLIYSKSGNRKNKKKVCHRNWLLTGVFGVSVKDVGSEEWEKEEEEEKKQSHSRVNCLPSPFVSSVKMKMENNLSICGAYCFLHWHSSLYDFYFHPITFFCNVVGELFVLLESEDPFLYDGNEKPWENG